MRGNIANPMFATTDTGTEPKYNYITYEDLSAYRLWCEAHVAAFNPVPSGPLYHYTTGNGLIEILKSGELWSTQVACLNDSSELLNPIEWLYAKVREKLTSPTSSEVEFLLKQIDRGLSEPKIATEGRFLACFSEDGDDLSQWRAYGGERAATRFNSTRSTFVRFRTASRYWVRSSTMKQNKMSFLTMSWRIPFDFSSTV